MTATSQPTLTMRDAAARIAKDARQNLAAVDVISVGPLFGEVTSGGVQYSVVAIVPDRGGKDFGKLCHAGHRG